MRVALAATLAGACLAGLASAATITGGAGGERLRGTPGADLILPRGGRDTIEARGGNDRIAVQYDGARDTVRCGPGRDVVNADRIDVLAADCEVVSRLISRDPYNVGDGQHASQAEPDGLAVGNRVVTTFQTGRRHDGGATDIGFSTSTDGGRTWRAGHLPAVTVFSQPAGTAAFASDPVVAYDARTGTWLISTLAVSASRTELYMSRSADGIRWGRPVVAAVFDGTDLAYDKNWAACDNWPQSPHFGRCYLAYTEHIGRPPELAVQTSDDGGRTWSRPVLAVRSAEVVGVLPVVRPDGALVIPYLGPGEMESVRSLDGGGTFEAPVRIAPYDFRRVAGGRLRSFPLPTADVDAAGRLYVAWQDCRFRQGCSANDIVLSTSPDGTSWSEPIRVTRDPGTAFIPELAVDRATGQLALAYHSCPSRCRVDVFLSTSEDGGVTWTAPQRLTAQSMRFEWMPTTTSGRMLGDYIAVTFARNRPVTVYALASETAGGKLRQAIAATRP